MKADFRAYELTTTSTRILKEDPARAGWMLQNNHATAKIYISQNGAMVQESCLCIYPNGGSITQDVLPPSGDLWAFTDTAGAALVIAVSNY